MSRVKTQRKNPEFVPCSSYQKENLAVIWMPRPILSRPFIRTGSLGILWEDSAVSTNLVHCMSCISINCCGLGGRRVRWDETSWDWNETKLVAARIYLEHELHYVSLHFKRAKTRSQTIESRTTGLKCWFSQLTVNFVYFYPTEQSSSKTFQRELVKTWNIVN